MQTIEADSKLQGLKIMVVDDSKTIRRAAETLLEKEGCQVIAVVDGYEALVKIKETKPDVVFIDVMMPKLDGYQTCAMIKQNHLFASVPVIMLSSKDGLFDRVRGRASGATRYLTKPFTRDELIKAISQCIHGNSQAEAAQPADNPS